MSVFGRRIRTFGRDAPLQYVALSSSNRKDTQMIDHQPRTNGERQRLFLSRHGEESAVQNTSTSAAESLPGPPLRLRCIHVCFLFSCVSKKN